MFKRVIYLFLVVALFSLNAEAKRKPKEPPVDHMSLATMMIYDGSYEKALLELEQVDINKKHFDFAKYYSMSGIVAIKMQNYQNAIVNFDKAIEATRVKKFEAPKEAKEKFTLYKYFFKKEKKKKVVKEEFDPEKVRMKKIGQLHLYKAEAYYKLKAYKETIQALDQAGEMGNNKAQLFTLRAECYWKLKEHSSAFNILNRGFAKFPKDTTLLKQKFYYYIDLGLYQRAIDISNEYFSKVEPKAKDYVTFAQALSGAGELDKAIKVLETAKLLFPKDAQTGVMLGHLYYKKDMGHTTAHLFEKSSYYEKKYLAESAEMYRRAKEFPHALYLNSQITDNVEKIKQKVAIYIEREEFEKVLGLKSALFRYNMLEDENLRYALAYSYFMVKDYTKAEFHLKKLTKSELFSKATMIRKNIEKCKKNSMECI